MSWITDRVNAQDAARIGTWPTFAGHLCATHIGEWVAVRGEVGRIAEIRFVERKPTVLIVLRREGGHPAGPTCALFLEPDEVLTKLVRSFSKGLA